MFRDVLTSTSPSLSSKAEHPQIPRIGLGRGLLLSLGRRRVADVEQGTGGRGRCVTDEAQLEDLRQTGPFLLVRVTLLRNEAERVLLPGPLLEPHEVHLVRFASGRGLLRGNQHVEFGVCPVSDVVHERDLAAEAIEVAHPSLAIQEDAQE